jgi:hypothetical protein
MRYRLFFMLILLSAAAHGQDYRTQARQYEQRKQDNKVAEQRIHQQYLNNLPNSASGTPGNRAAAAELERLFKKESTVPAVSLDEQIKRQLEFTAGWRKDIEREKNYEKTYGTLADTLKAAGFTYPEAYYMSKYGINGSTSSPRAILEIMNAKIALRDFKTAYPSASYQKLLQLALAYRMAGLTCISSLRKIELRFPEKKGDIDLMVLKIMPAFYQYTSTTLDIEHASQAQNNYMMDMFTALLKKFPIEANNMADTCLASPYSSIQAREWMKKRDDLDQKAAIFFCILQAPETADSKPGYHEGNQQRKLEKLLGCLRFFRYHPSYLKDLSADDWQRIELAKGLTAAEMKAYMYKLPNY